jgi:hypothetical protein
MAVMSRSLPHAVRGVNDSAFLRPAAASLLRSVARHVALNREIGIEFLTMVIPRSTTMVRSRRTVA